MKQLLLILFLLLFTFSSTAQNVGINTIGAVPDNSAILDLNSSDKGFLITRADTANINSPAFGLMTLSPIDSCLYLYNGNTWKGMGGGGSNCSCNCTTPPTLYCGVDTITAIVDVTSVTGRIWMDRNLGASQAATSSTDAAAYGDLYQWGRCSDGHEKRNSGTTPILSTSNDPGHSNFITRPILTAPNDWRDPQNDNLWQGTTGINNPCPTGYRLPTESEFDVERLSWTSNDAAGAFSSALKLSVGGNRSIQNGLLISVDSFGDYWNSTVDGSNSRHVVFGSTNSFLYGTNRGYGLSMRCIKD